MTINYSSTFNQNSILTENHLPPKKYWLNRFREEVKFVVQHENKFSTPIRSMPISKEILTLTTVTTSSKTIIATKTSPLREEKVMQKRALEALKLADLVPLDMDSQTIEIQSTATKVTTIVPTTFNQSRRKHDRYDWKKWGGLIIELRSKYSLSLNDLAEITGIGFRSISDMLRKKRRDLQPIKGIKLNELPLNRQDEIKQLIDKVKDS